MSQLPIRHDFNPASEMLESNVKKETRAQGRKFENLKFQNVRTRPRHTHPSHLTPHHQVTPHPWFNSPLKFKSLNPSSVNGSPKSKEHENAMTAPLGRKVQCPMSKQDERWKNHHRTQEEVDLQLQLTVQKLSLEWQRRIIRTNRFHFVKYRLYHNTQTQNRGEKHSQEERQKSCGELQFRCKFRE